MTKQDLTKAFKAAQLTVSKHSPEILTGIGIAGMFTTCVLAVKGTPKALKRIEEKKQEEHKDKLTALETVQATWKCYIPAAITATVSTACLIGSSSVSLKRNAALATAYQISQTALTEYKEKVVETIGEKKEQAVKDAIAKEKVEKKPVSTSEIYVTKNGKTRFLDAMSGRYFESDIESVKRAMNDLNAKMLHDMFGYASVNDLYDEIGLSRVDMGEYVGWNVNHLIDINFSAQIGDDGQPVIVLGHDNEPRYGYDKYM